MATIRPKIATRTYSNEPSNSRYPGQNNRLYQYTKGNEFSLDGVPYVGEYHYNGTTPYTGPIPADDTQVLRRIYRNVDHYIYDHLQKFDSQVLRYKDPKPILYRPTDQAYVIGYDSRYFVEKVEDEYSYAIEIDVDQYNNISTRGGIDGGLYLSTVLKWKLTGGQQEIIEHNKYEVYKGSVNCPSVEYSIRNFLEFSRITLV